MRRPDWPTGSSIWRRASTSPLHADRQIAAVTPDPMSDPPAAEPHPPLPIAIDIHVRRWAPDDAVVINISAIDLQVLLEW